MRGTSSNLLATTNKTHEHSRLIFLRIFLSLMAISGVTALVTLVCVKGTVPLPPSLWTAGFAIVVVIAGISFAVTHGMANSSRLLSQQILSSDPASGPVKKRRIQSLVFGEVMAAWRRVDTQWEQCLNQYEQLGARRHAELGQFMRMVAKAVEERSPHLRGHAERVAMYSGALARQLGLEAPAAERIELAALVHDLGMISIEDRVLRNTGLLLPEEFEILKAHPAKGASLLRPVESLQDLIPGVELHHESIDGRGYPYGLCDTEIPMAARIIAVADAFDAMTTDRPYQAAMTPKYVLQIMGRMAGMRYDAQVVAALNELVTNGSISVAAPGLMFESFEHVNG